MSFVEVNKGVPTGVSTGGVGYIIIPQGTDRNTYIANCYRMHMVSIDGGLGYSAIHNVKITSEALAKIKFPDTDEEKGTAVVWIRENFYNRPIIIGTLESVGESGMTSEYQQQIIQQTAEQVVNIFLDALNATLDLSIQGTKEVPAKLTIKAMGSEDEDELNVKTDGTMSLEAKKLNVTISEDLDLKITDNSQKEILHIVGNKEKLVVEDHFSNSVTFSEGNVKILTERFDVGKGKEQMVLGNTLVKTLGELIDAILQLTVVTPTGPSGTPINAPVFTSIKNRLDIILSKLSNTD